jgi:hypothetical protein
VIDEKENGGRWPEREEARDMREHEKRRAGRPKVKRLGRAANESVGAAQGRKIAPRVRAANWRVSWEAPATLPERHHFGLRNDACETTRGAPV